MVPAFISVGSCLFLAIIYVASLYVWTPVHNRDHPSTIRKRFLSVFIVMIISPVFVKMFLPTSVLVNASIWNAMGFRTDGLLAAIVVPLLLTALLFFGPLTLQGYNGTFKLYAEPMYWWTSMKNILWLRNHLVAPLSEEFTFRACMLPLLLQSFTPGTAILITPLFFGVAHLHHMVERIRAGMEMKTVIIFSTFQFVYTTMFGIYSAYLFTRTGHFVAPFVAHAFCNHMGFPDFREVWSQKNSNRTILLGSYVLGLIGWIVLLPVLTNPAWYSNTMYTWPSKL